MTVGENIRKIRTEKKLTQKQLGELCGINEANIRKYELGKANPKIETVEKIASALHVHIRAIKNNLSLDELEKTDFYKNSQKHSRSLDGILAILAEIYGKAEEITLQGITGSTGCCYTVGEGENEFILTEDDIQTLYDFALSSFQIITNNMIDKTIPAKEFIAEYQAELDEELDEELEEDAIHPIT